MRFELGTVTGEQVAAFWRVSTRLDRAVEMIDKVHDNAPGIAIVDSQTKSKVHYVTDLRAGTCECADWTYRSAGNSNFKCKHLLAALIKHRMEQSQ